MHVYKQVPNNYSWGTTSCPLLSWQQHLFLVSIFIYPIVSLSTFSVSPFSEEFFSTILNYVANFSGVNFTSQNWCDINHSTSCSETAQSRWCWWMTVSSKSCWYCTFSLKIKTCLSLHTTSEHPPPQSPPVIKKGTKRHKARERDRWSGRSFPCPPLLFELFFSFFQFILCFFP